MRALFLCECKKVAGSLTTLIFVAALFLMAVSQGVLNFAARDDFIKEPQPGLPSYGIKTEEVPAVIMPEATKNLYMEFSKNNYTAYPIGVYKNVKLDAAKQAEMAAILADLTGIPKEVLQEDEDRTLPDKNSMTMGEDSGINPKENSDGSHSVTVSETPPEETVEKQKDVNVLEGMDYSMFQKYMNRADELIGGGSSYGKDYLNGFGKVPVTYEETKADYDNVREKDHFTGAYARLFCDYLGIMVSLLPVFMAVAISLKDRRAGMSTLIYSRKISSLKLIITRYLAVLTVAMVPIVVLIIISNVSVWSFHSGEVLNYGAPLSYAFGWLMPSVMISAAVGLFFTELTDTPIAIVIQGIWWFIDLNRGISKMVGGYGLTQLTPRHNALGETLIFTEGFNQLVANRLFFAGLSVALLLMSVIIYEQKRRGRFNGYDKIKQAVTGLFPSRSHRSRQS